MDQRGNVVRPRNNCHTLADTDGVSMQLRLVEGPTADPARRQADAIGRPGAASRKGTAAAAKGKAKGERQGQGRGAKAIGTGRPVRGTVRGARGRAVHWADWHLDARTRRVGRAGVAAAKAALEQAARPEPGTPLSKAS
jgi:hypothetical protein